MAAPQIEHTVTGSVGCFLEYRALSPIPRATYTRPWQCVPVMVAHRREREADMNIKVILELQSKFGASLGYMKWSLK